MCILKMKYEWLSMSMSGVCVCLCCTGVGKVSVYTVLLLCLSRSCEPEIKPWTPANLFLLLFNRTMALGLHARAGEKFSVQQFSCARVLNSVCLFACLFVLAFFHGHHGVKHSSVAAASGHMTHLFIDLCGGYCDNWQIRSSRYFVCACVCVFQKPSELVVISVNFWFSDI